MARFVRGPNAGNWTHRRTFGVVLRGLFIISHAHAIFDAASFDQIYGVHGAKDAVEFHGK
jgi:hypothetical protein